ncbi:MAG: MbnP family protein [Bacteroidota bacterium]
MKQFLLALFLLNSFNLSAQDSQNLSVNFKPTFNGEPLVLTDDEADLSGKDIQIETFRFYISKVELLNGGEIVYEEPNSFHLLDVSNPLSLNLSLNFEFNAQNPITHLKFQIGIDSLTNVSGAFGGDLDPSNGMYWTWQSGYINFKLEGVAAECPARHNRFQFHIGGYQGPYKALQTVSLPVANIEEVNIQLRLEDFMGKINLEETYQVMSPNKISHELAILLPSMFSIVR